MAAHYELDETCCEVMTKPLESSQQVASRHRLEHAIRSGIDARIVLKLILDDKWGIKHLHSGLGGEIGLDGRTSFVRFCAYARRFDVFKAIFENDAVQIKLAPSCPIDVLMTRMDSTVNAQNEIVADPQPMGMSLIQIGARQLYPEMLEYALQHPETTVRYRHSDDDEYAAGFLSLMCSLTQDNDNLVQIERTAAALECSRLLLGYSPTRGRSKECLASAALAAGSARGDGVEVARQILLDHFKAERIDPKYTALNGHGGNDPLIHQSIKALNRPLALAQVDFQFLDPDLETWLEDEPWGDGTQQQLATECLLELRAHRMNREISLHKGPAVIVNTTVAAANSAASGARRLRLV